MKSLKRGLKGFLQAIDTIFFMVSIPIFYKRRPKYSTLVGKVLSILMILTLLSYTTVLLVQLFGYQNPPNTTLFYVADQPTMTISSDNFTVGIAIMIGNQLMNTSDAYFSISMGTGNQTSIIDHMKVTPCNITLGGNSSSNFFCPPDNYTITVTNSEQPDLLNIFLIEIGPCKNDSIMNCSPNSNDINKIMLEIPTYVIVVLDVNGINQNEYDPYVPFQVYNTFPLQPGLMNFYPAFFDNYTVVDSFGTIFITNQSKSISHYDIGQSVSFQIEASDDIYFRMWVIPSWDWLVTSREYLNLENVFVNLGGLKHSIQTIFTIAALILTPKLLKIKIGKIFVRNSKNKLQDETKGKDINNYTKEKYREQNFSHLREFLRSKQRPSVNKLKIDFSNKKSIHEDEEILSRFTEKTLDVSKILTLQQSFNNLSQVLLTEDQRNVLFYQEDIFLKKEDLNFDKNNYKGLKIDPITKEKYISEALLSKETIQFIKSRLRKADINKINQFLSLFGHYLEISKRNSELDRQIINLVDEYTRESLIELKEVAGDNYYSANIERAIQEAFES